MIRDTDSASATPLAVPRDVYLRLKLTQLLALRLVAAAAPADSDLDRTLLPAGAAPATQAQD